MSEPKRYEPSTQCVEPSYQAQMIEPIVREVAWGNYVRWEDYARLKAQVERLTAKQTDIDRVQAQSDFYRSKLINETAYTANVQLLDQVKHLEAQVERLTKAALQVHQELDEFGQVSAKSVNELRDAAKGVQS